jgi:integrase/recombinase XerC/integrase/recombinase XerD
MPLTEALEAFILDQRLKGNSAKTVRGYLGFLGRFLSWLEGEGVTDCATITLQHVQRYHLHISSKPSERGKIVNLAKKSVQTYIRHIKIFLRFCYAENFIASPMHERVKIPKATRPLIEIVTDAELTAILDTFGNDELGLRNTAIILLLLDCGIRLSELSDLKTANINFERGIMKVLGKGNKERFVPVGKKVREALSAYINVRRPAVVPADDGFLLMSVRRTPLTSHGVSCLMGKLKKRSGVQRIHAHLFRHTFATNFLVHGLGDVYELSRILGHDDLQTTEQYLQVASLYTIIERREAMSYLDRRN